MALVVAAVLLVRVGGIGIVVATMDVSFSYPRVCLLRVLTLRRSILAGPHVLHYGRRSIGRRIDRLGSRRRWDDRLGRVGPGRSHRSHRPAGDDLT